MVQLTAAERLTQVKYLLYGNGEQTYNDVQLQLFINEVMDELINGGVKREVAESTAAVGCIAVGVTDIWNYTSGGVKHSDYFNRRLVQLSLRKADEPTNEQAQHERVIFDIATTAIDFTLSYTSYSIIRVFVNGISVAETEDYTIRGNTIIFSGTMIAGTEIDVYIYG